jgi:hypothetical protein
MQDRIGPMMTPDQWCETSWRANPGSFLALMTLYESNYIRLGWLCGDLRCLPEQGCARMDAAVTLAFRVEERGPYTTLLRLLLQLSGPSIESAPLPDLYVRVYHDARLVEASDVRCTGETTASLPVAGNELAPRWARNMLLNKWLEYCADRGCRLLPATAQTA